MSNNNQQPSKPKKKKARARKGRSARSAESRSAKDPRFNLSLKNLETPIGKLGGLEFGTRNAGGWVGLAKASRNPLVRMPTWRSGRTKRGEKADILCGSDLVCSVTTNSAGQLSGDILCSVNVTPAAFVATRLAQQAPLYERFEFEKIVMKFAPTQSAMEAGQLMGFFDPDPSIVYSPSDPTNLAKAAAHNGISCQIWEEMNWEFKTPDEYTTLYTSPGGEDPRLNIQAVFYLMAASSLGASLAVGNIYIEYECAFFLPTLQSDINPKFFAGTAVSTAAATPLGSQQPVPATSWSGNLMNNFFEYSPSSGSSPFTFTGLPVNTIIWAYFHLTTPSASAGLQTIVTLNDMTAVGGSLDLIASTNEVYHVAWVVTGPTPRVTFGTLNVAPSEADFTFVTSPPLVTNSTLSMASMQRKMRSLEDNLRQVLATMKATSDKSSSVICVSDSDQDRRTCGEDPRPQCRENNNCRDCPHTTGGLSYHW